MVFVLLAGCRTNATRVAGTHVDLLEAMARKGADLVASERLTAENMPELTYPLERAEAFARGQAGAPWSGAFAALLARYREFLDALDRIRREQRGAAAGAALGAPLAAVESAADAARAALRSAAR